MLKCQLPSSTTRCLCASSHSTMPVMMQTKPNAGIQSGCIHAPLTCRTNPRFYSVSLTQAIGPAQFIHLPDCYFYLVNSTYRILDASPRQNPTINPNNATLSWLMLCSCFILNSSGFCYSQSTIQRNRHPIRLPCQPIQANCWRLFLILGCGIDIVASWNLKEVIGDSHLFYRFEGIGHLRIRRKISSSN